MFERQSSKTRVSTLQIATEPESQNPTQMAPVDRRGQTLQPVLMLLPQVVRRELGFFKNRIYNWQQLIKKDLTLESMNLHRLLCQEVFLPSELRTQGVYGGAVSKTWFGEWDRKESRRFQHIAIVSSECWLLGDHLTARKAEPPWRSAWVCLGAFPVILLLRDNFMLRKMVFSTLFLFLFQM